MTAFSREWNRTHTRPANKNAKYYTYCKNCKQTLIKVPIRGPFQVGHWQHPVIAIGDFGADIIGFRDHCIIYPEQNWDDMRSTK